MKVAVSGSSGLIGSALVPRLEAAGHSVLRLVRGPAVPGPAVPGTPEAIRWDPRNGVLDSGLLAGVSAAVHLAGEGIAEKRWTPAQKQRILASRVASTRLLAGKLAELDPRPKVLVSGSAVGFYGDRGDEVLTEESSGGTGFLADLVAQWEAATEAAELAGIRVVHIRTGIVLSPAGGALKRQLPLFKVGLGGTLGSGRQYQSWISIADEVGAIVHALTADALAGPVNLTAPNPVTNAELTRTLGAVLGRPAVLRIPRLALSLALGRELVDEALLASQRVLPAKLEESGYSFEAPHLDGAVRVLLHK